MIGLCFHITNFESIFHRPELNVAYNYEKIELCNKAIMVYYNCKTKKIKPKSIKYILGNIQYDFQNKDKEYRNMIMSKLYSCLF